jgi:hypothetical protein
MMMMRRSFVIALLALAACDAEPVATPREVMRAMPDYGRLGGGTLITIEGSGFVLGDRVLVGGREAPLVDVIDDTHIEVVVPPGTQPGDAELVVFGPSGTTSRRDIFRYSEPPAIAGVSPDDVVAVVADTTVTVRGSGFLDEDAGAIALFVDGQPITDVVVVDDTTLTFVAPLGRVFAHPTIEIFNARGRADRPRAFRYTPSASPGLLLFPRFSAAFAVFYDPATGTAFDIPTLTTGSPRFTSVTRAADGLYWAIDTAGRIGRLDLETQTMLTTTNTSTRLPAMMHTGDQFVAIARFFGASGGRIGTVDPSTGTFSPIGTTQLFCCGSYGITTDGTTVWFTSRKDWSTYQINTVDLASGGVGTPVTLTGGPSYRPEELRWWRGALYATTINGRLVTIDPNTGAVTDVHVGASRYSALEPFEP